MCFVMYGTSGSQFHVRWLFSENFVSLLVLFKTKHVSFQCFVCMRSSFEHQEIVDFDMIWLTSVSFSV